MRPGQPQRVLAAFAAAAIAALSTAPPALAHGGAGNQPAGGAAVGEAIGATAGAIVAMVVIGLVIAGHRTGRLRLLERLAAVSRRTSGLPVWAALPSAVLGICLITAVLGMYWDISLHIDNGRDEGPLANPAHYLILIGLFGVLLAGVLTAALARERPGASALTLGRGWYVPVGGVVIAACGAFALTGFPLDDLWHRLFGQDVTLWGPTHLMLIGGGSLAVLGVMILMTEAIRGLGRDPDFGHPTILQVRRGLLAGGFLVALSTFQGEFDFGVPQFRLVLHPVLIMLAAGVGLVAARYYLGRGGALYAVGGFLVIRGFLALMVGGVWDQTTPHFPLYIVEAVIVELVIARGGGRSPVAMGALAGVGIGTVGLAAEWGWSHVWMPIPWPEAMLPETIALALPTAIAAGAVGGFVGGALAWPRPVPPVRIERWAALAGAAVVVAVVGSALPLSTDGPDRATVALREVVPGKERAVEATIRVTPPEAARDPEFLNVTAWQGRGSVVDPLEQVGPGVYRTTKPIPVHGAWKATLRMQKDDALVSLPLFLPKDKAIPAPETPAADRFTREFVADHEVLQRERKEGVSGGVTAAAYLTVLAISVGLMGLLAWALIRVESGGGPPRRSQRLPRQARLV
jgi:hypothetical protein